VDILQDIGADGGVQVGLHVLEDQVEVAVVVGLEDICERDDVLMPLHLLQEHDLTKGALGVGGVLEGVEDLLQRAAVLCPLVHGLPHDTVGALAQLELHLVPLENMAVDFLGHG